MIIFTPKVLTVIYSGHFRLRQWTPIWWDFSFFSIMGFMGLFCDCKTPAVGMV